MSVPGFVIVCEEEEGDGEGTVHTAVTDKTGIQKLVTLSEVSSMQEELPTEDAAAEDKKGKKGTAGSDRAQFQCSICMKTLVSLKSLKRHKKNLHPEAPDDDTNDTDPDTSKAVERPSIVVKDQVIAQTIAVELQNIQTKGARKRPKYNSNKIHPCAICGKAFATPSIRNRHMVVHTRVKPYKCSYCEKSYSQLEHLRRHESSHTGENMFVCTVCSKRFVEKSRYSDHMMAHLEETPYRCDMCQKGFTHRVGLQKHLRIHTGQKNHECGICHKRFFEKQTLRVHERIHSGDHPYRCSQCNKGFGREKLLAVHMRNHGQDRPFECKICLKRFNSRQGLTGHQKLHADGKNASVLNIPLQCQTPLQTPSQLQPEQVRMPPVNASPNEPVNKSEGLYQCEFCTRTFERKCSLTVHKKAMHPTVGSKILLIKCGQCGLTFHSIPEAQEHVKVHKGESDSNSTANHVNSSAAVPDAMTAAQALQEFSLQNVVNQCDPMRTGTGSECSSVSDQGMYVNASQPSSAHLLTTGSGPPVTEAVFFPFPQNTSDSTGPITFNATQDAGFNCTQTQQTTSGEQNVLLEGLEMYDVGLSPLEISNKSLIVPQPEGCSAVKERHIPISAPMAGTVNNDGYLSRVNKTSTGELYSATPVEIPAQGVQFHDQDVMDDWTSELAKCPAMSGMSGEAWKVDHTYRGMGSGGTHWPTPSLTLTTDDDISVCPAQQCEGKSVSYDQGPEVIHTPPPTFTEASEPDSVDRKRSFVVSDVLKDYMPAAKRKRRRSI